MERGCLACKRVVVVMGKLWIRDLKLLDLANICKLNSLIVLDREFIAVWTYCVDDSKELKCKRRGMAGNS